MKGVSVLLSLILGSQLCLAKVTQLSPSTVDALTEGKSVFIKFFAPWVSLIFGTVNTPYYTYVFSDLYFLHQESRSVQLFSNLYLKSFSSCLLCPLASDHIPVNLGIYSVVIYFIRFLLLVINSNNSVDTVNGRGF
jgi:hypothetical protein